MTALVRTALKDSIQQAKTAHAGLLLTRSLPVWEQNEKSEKTRLIEKITCVSPSDLYKNAFSRWLAVTGKPEHFGSLTATVSGRLMMGLSTGGAMETGIITHHTYGMPMIPGSSVKGAVRAFANSIGLDARYQAVLFGADEELAERSKEPEGAGCLVWHDAWWVPEGNHKPFVGEVVTVHHQQYYGGHGEATDFDSPVPNQQLAVQGSFYFVVEGEPGWVSLAIRLLQDTLQQQGMGAKRAAGYGFMKENAAVTQKARQGAAEAIKQQEMAVLPPHIQALKTFTAAFDDDKHTNKSRSRQFQTGSTLGQELIKLFDQVSPDWPAEDLAALRKLTTDVFLYLGLDRKKNETAKKLWQKLPSQ